MKIILKWVGIAFVILIVIGIIGSAGKSNKLSSDSKTISSSKPQSSPTPAPTTLPKQNPSAIPTSTSAKAGDTIKVTRVVDGDTIEIEGGKRVRYIGIDTPETVDPRKPVQCFGKEASDKNKELVLGKEVRLEKDVSETDKYGRLLRYVYVGDTFVNDYLVRQGYAYASSYPPDIKYQNQFSQSQVEAKNNKRGLWADNACSTSSTEPTYQAPTTNAQPKTTNTSGSCKYSCSGPDKDCSDFSTHAEAQSFFNCCGFTATYDPMRLDSAKGVGNGIACESRP